MQATHLINFHNDEQLVVLQVDLVARSDYCGHLLDYTVSGQDVVVAHCRPDGELLGPRIVSNYL